MDKAIQILEHEVDNPALGLPDSIFYYISKTTPLVNVDLLIKDHRGRTLLSWRDDKYCGKGWHIPGGIIRFKETFEERIRRVAETELGIAGTVIEFDSEPMAINQIINSRRNIRGHFISLLYRCSVPEDDIPVNRNAGLMRSGDLKWHEFCPLNLIKVHKIYEKHI